RKVSKNTNSSPSDIKGFYLLSKSSSHFDNKSLLPTNPNITLVGIFAIRLINRSELLARRRSDHLLFPLTISSFCNTNCNGHVGEWNTLIGSSAEKFLLCHAPSLDHLVDSIPPLKDDMMRKIMIPTKFSPLE